MVKLYYFLRRHFPLWLVDGARKLIQRGYLLLMYGDIWFPMGIQIEVCKQCNRRCSYCPQSVEPTERETMDWGVFQKCLERVAELNWPFTLEFHFYNEPLLVKDLETWVARARTFCPRAFLRVTTNGDLLTEKRLLSLVEAGVQNFYVTRHPPYSKRWDDNMAALQSKYGQYLVVSCIEDVPLFNRGGMVKPKNLVPLWETGCQVASSGLHITINGDYEFCCCDYRRTETMGNVRDIGIVGAWRNPFYAAARKAAREANPTLDLCKECFKKP